MMVFVVCLAYESGIEAVFDTEEKAQEYIESEGSAYLYIEEWEVK